MRVTNARDLGLVVRQARIDQGKTQAELADEAGVSRRWLSDLEAGKATAEVGLVLRTLAALGVGLDTYPLTTEAEQVDLDKLLHGDRDDHA